jgi:hypothetical protein
VRRNLALALTVLFVVFAFWAGEGGSLPSAGLPATSTIVASIAIAIVVPGKLWVKSVGGFCALTLCAVALIFGYLSFASAFSECVEKGEEVRGKLNEFYQKQGHFPERLAHLEGAELCGRILRPTLLEYERTTKWIRIIFCGLAR